MINLQNRRLSRKKSQLLEAYDSQSGKGTQKMTLTSRKNVIFTMIDPQIFKSTLNKFSKFK